jgi:hypothetical protein
MIKFTIILSLRPSVILRPLGSYHGCPYHMEEYI